MVNTSFNQVTVAYRLPSKFTSNAGTVLWFLRLNYILAV